MTSTAGVAFVGGRSLGAECLQSLLDAGVPIACVLARADEGSLRTERTVAEIADEHHLPCIAPASPRPTCVSDWVRSHRPSVGFCVMYPRILPQHFLDVPPRGIFNLHGSPLPQYRGVLGHAWAIINDDPDYGVSLHRMVTAVDAGPVVARRMFPIARDETGWTLHTKAVVAARDLFVEMAPRLAETDVPEQPQDERLAAYYSRRPPYDRAIDWTWRARDLARYLRAMEFPGIPMPSVAGVEVLSARPREDAEVPDCEPGTVVDISSAGADIRVGDGMLLVEAIRLSAQAPVTSGFRIADRWTVGERLAA